MARRDLVLVCIAVTVLAGCLGGPAATQSTPGDESSAVSGDDVPGVSNSTLTNATALARANEAALSDRGAEVVVSHAEAGEESAFRLRLAAGFSTYTLSGTYPGGEQSIEFDSWTNETSRFVRMGSADDVRYQVVSRDSDLPSGIRTVESLLASGRFTVSDESPGDGTVVLTAAEPARDADGQGRFSDVSSFDGRLVVEESGLIHNLTVSAVNQGRTVRDSYELRDTGVEEVPQPDWLADLPDGATLEPDLDVTVENDSHLVVRHRGGDAVPDGSILSLTTNGATTNATFETRLVQGEQRYAYIHAATGELRVTDDRPDAEDVESVTSPISVSLATGDGVTLYSGGMAWDSGSESADGQSGGSTSEGREG